MFLHLGHRLLSLTVWSTTPSVALAHGFAPDLYAPCGACEWSPDTSALRRASAAIEGELRDSQPDAIAGGYRATRPRSTTTVGPAPTSDRKEITVDLANAHLQGTLPFDVEFDLVGTVPGDTRTLVVAWRDITAATRTCQRTARAATRGQSKDSARAAERRCALEVQLGDTEAWSHAQERTWNPSGLNSGTDLKFRVTIPALDAERSFAFRFTIRRAIEAQRLAKYRSAVRPRLGRLLESYSSETLNDTQFAELRTQARQLLADQLGPYELIEKDPVFDDTVPPASALDAFAELVNDPILTAQVRRRLILKEELPRITTILEDSLRALQASGPFQRALPAFLGDPTLSRVLKDHPAVQELLTAGAGVRRQWAHGQDGTAPGSDLAEATTAAGVDPFISHYAQLRARLVELQNVFSDVIRPNGPYADHVSELVTAGKLSTADLGALRRELGEDGRIADLTSQVDEAASGISRVRQALESISAGLDALSESVTLAVRTAVVISANTIGDFNTFHGYYVSADAGFLYAFGLDAAAPYIGTNIYFRPVNRDAPLSLRGGIGRRLSLTVGLTVKSLSDDGQTRKDLFGGASGVVGVGLRVRQAIRLAAGGVVFRQKSTDPLRNNYSLAVNPFAAFSLDIDPAGLGGALASLFK